MGGCVALEPLPLSPSLTLLYTGFIILNHLTPEVLKQFYDEVPPLVADGSIPVKEAVTKGLDNVRPSLSLDDLLDPQLTLSCSLSLCAGRVLCGALRLGELELRQGALALAPLEAVPELTFSSCAGRHLVRVSAAAHPPLSRILIRSIPCT